MCIFKIRTKILFIALLFLANHSFLIANDKKQSIATKALNTIVIDGVLNENEWQSASKANQFIQTEPFNGKSATFDTHVYVLYDDNALYIGALILDPSPDSIAQELRSRDIIGQADYFGVKIDPFNDGLNAFGFFVTAKGVQIDMKTNNWDEDDVSWNAVWKSSTSILENGWSVEMMIPYSALRFPKGEQQKWGVNFYRSIQRKREYSTWNFIDSKSKGTLRQMGETTIPSRIEPPLRLSATPYLSAAVSHHSDNNKWSGAYNAGMDLKVGLTESFTLDLTLIPDFGQVESDDKIFSLSPFEVFYEEKRPFFTEGTELFSKGNVFYSRRIGATPQGYSKIRQQYEANEIISNPENIQLINAAKLSGKTSKGLGIGVFNALTENTFATVKDSTGNEERVLTESAANFNMFVFEQALPNNSQVTFYNTNVYKPKDKYIANVTGTEFALRNKKNRYEISGMLNVSQHFSQNKNPVFGERFFLKTGKVSGNFQADTWFNYVSDTYNPNDMGFQLRNNELANGWNFRYNEYEPKGNLLRWYGRFYVNHYYLHQPRSFAILELGGDGRATFKNHLTLGGNISFTPLGYRDFYEPRVKERYVQWPAEYTISFWGSPDYRKKIMADYRFGISHAPDLSYVFYWARFTPRWKVQENFLIIPEIRFDYQNNSYGYVRDSINFNNDRVILFGRRNVENITSSITADYIFTPDLSLAFRLRHYWLNVNYLDFFNLTNEGKFTLSDYSRSEDFAINTFNIDMVFKWNFAPGSELLLVWKNAVYSQNKGEALTTGYFNNLEQTLNSPAANSLNIKLLYYIDWQNIKPSRSNSFSESGGRR
jgi:hypothetical protein